MLRLDRRGCKCPVETPFEQCSNESRPGPCSVRTRRVDRAIQLRATKFAILSDVEIELGVGMNVLTGETGAVQC